ncbi:glycosyltransferase family 2 protein [Sulfolobus acidocaldarius]|uniref:Conserved protein n=1 Tax=Sulfolobus acidocaldarius (strain ATCC 33909 / DSM 639 / JCM 8929 / NBRC 15157 / NCIMB 11770) TaxID=330779 RepID=Q4JA62_SULAC|nr:glycosyltransferase family 2 protein [Sulfolobus acidocaldarius]AAY80318.1 conserved protein [Sulfolobus acidocaldarius DSM 639]
MLGKSQKDDHKTTFNKHKKTFSIIVAIKDESKQVIESLVENLKRINYERYEVIIVSDDDESKFREYLEIKFPENFRLIRRESNSGGKAGALNFASRISKGDYLVFMDADARVNEDFLQRLNNKDYVACSLKIIIYDTSTSIQSYYAEFTEKVMDMMFKGRSKLGLPIFPNGSAFSIRRDTLLSIGGWKENAIAEDLELGIRMYLNDLKNLFYDDVVVFLKSPYTLMDLYNQIQRWSYGSSQLLKSSLKLLKKGIKGFEGLLYSQQWVIYPLFFTVLGVYGILTPVFNITQTYLLLLILIYGISVVFYSQVLNQKRVDIKILKTILDASITGYLKGLFGLKYKWRVTPKILDKGGRLIEDNNIPLISIPFYLISFFDASMGFVLSSIVILLVALIESF